MIPKGIDCGADVAYEVTIRANLTYALFDLKGTKEALLTQAPEIADLFADRPNTLSANDRRMMYWIGPQHWILRGPLSKESEMFSLLRIDSAPENISLALISDTLSFFEISGSDATQIMAVASPLDTHPSEFPVNSATYTEAFGLKALIARVHDGFELAVDRSFAAMVEDYLTRAVGN